MTKHIMLDLETLGRDANAVILSVGAVVFDPNRLLADGELSPAASDGFHVRLAVPEQVVFGRTVTGDTLDWWLWDPAQDPARAALRAMPVVGVVEGLWGFHDWAGLRDAALGEEPSVYLWGNGSMFDNTIISHALETLCGVGLDHRIHRCYRTLKALYPNAPRPEDSEVAHDALADALWQAAHLQMIVKHTGTPV